MLLQTTDLTKHYGNFTALDALSLSVRAGEVVGLLGPNGSGKTTALRLVMGFLRPTRGHASVGGHDCWSDGVRARKLVAYLPSELRLYENMNGRQLVHFLSAVRGHPITEELDHLARTFDIDLERPIANLSTGMKRKVALLQVLTPHAPLLLMDEPTNTLDPNMRDELLDQVKKARDRGQAVLFSSHVLSEVERVCDRVAVLRKGKLVHLQTMAELQEGRLVQARFLPGNTADHAIRLPGTVPGAPKQSDLQGTAPAPPDLPGLRVRQREGDRLVLEYTGPLPDLLSWLTRQPLIELRLEPLGLNAIYYRYHGNGE